MKFLITCHHTEMVTNVDLLHKCIFNISMETMTVVYHIES